jgi:hypothetical protein
MRFRVVDGAAINRRGGVYGPGEEFDATGDEAQELLESGMVERVDKPKSK